MKILRSVWKHLAVISALGIGIALSGAGKAEAQILSDSDLMQVTATVIPSCNVTPSPLSFGSVDGVAVATASAPLGISCVANLVVDITLDYGVRNNRTMLATLTADVLPYELWQDSGVAPVVPWGNVIGTDSVQYTGAGLATTDSKTVYGTIQPFSGLPADDYTDTVVAEVWY
jgi:spore coat protein U-like protein